MSLNHWLGIPAEGSETPRHRWWLFPSPDTPRLYLPVDRGGWPAALDLISSPKRRWVTRLALETFTLLRRPPHRSAGHGSPLDAWLSEIWPGQSFRHAVYVGTASGFAKDTVQCQDASGRVLGYVKVPRGPRSGEAIRREADTLELLAREFPGHDFYPKLLGHRDGLTVQSGPLPGKGEGPGQAADAGQVLRLLAGVSRRPLPWPDSPDRLAITTALGHLAAAGDPERGAILAAALARLDRDFSAAPPDHVLSHGDFVPWNLRGHVLVFDWEWSGERLLWHDALHFLWFPLLLAGPVPDFGSLMARWQGEAGRALRAGAALPECPAARRASATAYLASQYSFYVSSSLLNGDSLGSFPFLTTMGKLLAEAAAEEG